MNTEAEAGGMNDADVLSVEDQQCRCLDGGDSGCLVTIIRLYSGMERDRVQDGDGKRSQGPAGPPAFKLLWQ